MSCFGDRIPRIRCFRFVGEAQRSCVKVTGPQGLALALTITTPRKLGKRVRAFLELPVERSALCSVLSPPFCLFH